MIGNDVAHNTPSAVQQRCYTVDDLREIYRVPVAETERVSLVPDRGREIQNLQKEF